MLVKELQETLSKDIIDALKDVGISALNPVQIASLEPILNRKNTIIIAPTGSGKTEAAIIPVMENIIRRGGRALYITPLRALNRDMHRRLIKLGERIGISVDVRHGDTPRSLREKQSKSFPDILITTPETFQLLFLGKNLRRFLFEIKYVIIDELHELMSSDRGLQLVIGLERLEKYSPEFQRIGLSATISDPNTAAKFLCGERDFVIVDYRKIHRGLEKKYDVRVSMISYEDNKSRNLRISPEELIIEKIMNLIKEYKSVLIFTNTRQEAELLGFYASSVSEDLVVHHGSLSRDVRERIELLLRSGEAKGIICTSSLELGIDIGHIEYVIQVDSPRQVIRLAQRVGRSGHKLTYVSKGEILARNFKEALEGVAIVDLLRKGLLEGQLIRENALLPLFNQIIAYALENNGLFDVNYFYSIVRNAYPYRKLPKSLLDRCVNLAVALKYLKKGDPWYYVTRKGRLYFYENISMIPDEKKYNVIDTATRKAIGSLDEDFVIDIAEGDVIVLAGTPWQVIEKDPEKAVIKVSRDIITDKISLPKWVGENIPVSREVCEHVRDILSGICNIPLEILSKKETQESFLRELQNISLSLGSNIRHLISNVILEYITPSSHLFKYPVLIMYTFLGHRGNAALSILFSIALKLTGIFSFAIDYNAYAIYVVLPLNCDFDYVKNYVLRILPTIDFNKMKDHIIINTSKVEKFRRTFAKIARKLGFRIERRSKLEWLIERSLNKSSPYYFLMLEALNKFFYEKADLVSAKDFWEDIVNKNKHLVLIKGPTRLFYTLIYADLSIPRAQNADEEVSLQLFRERIESKLLYLICLNKKCGYVEEITPAEAMKYPRNLSVCPICGSSRGISKIKLSILTAHEKHIRDLEETSRLLSQFGYKALLAMGTTGVSVKTAKRILKKFGYSEYLLMKALRKAYLNYIRTRHLWKIS